MLFCIICIFSIYLKKYHRFTLNSLQCTADNINIESTNIEPTNIEPIQIFESNEKKLNTNFINDGSDDRFSENTNLESLSTILVNIHKQKLLKNLQDNISIENKLQLIKNSDFLDNKVKIFDIFAGGLMENSDFSFTKIN